MAGDVAGRDTHSHWLHLTGVGILIGCIFQGAILIGCPLPEGGGTFLLAGGVLGAYFGSRLRENSLWNEWNASKMSLLKWFHSLSYKEPWDPAEKVTKMVCIFFHWC